MRLAIVPMKPLARAKARLAELFSPEERRRLSLAMLSDVVRAARALDRVWVLCSDDDAARVAESAGAEPRADKTPDGGLNASLDAATADALAEGVDGALVLSADCPAATADDVRALALGRGVVIGPNRTGTGTNALWRMPPDAIGSYFGPRSRQAHESVARSQGVPMAVVARQGIALDVDGPQDVAAAWRYPTLGQATRAALKSLGYPERS